MPGYDPRTIGRTETAGLGARGQVCSVFGDQISLDSGFLTACGEIPCLSEPKLSIKGGAR